MIYFALLIQQTQPFTIDSTEVLSLPARRRSAIRLDPLCAMLASGAKIEWTPVDLRSFSIDAPKLGAFYYKLNFNVPETGVWLINANGAGSLWVNNTPKLTDVYRYGTYYVPVQLKKGLNSVIVTPGRGNIEINWRKVEKNVQFIVDENDATLPDIHDGDLKGKVAGIVVHHLGLKESIATINGKDFHFQPLSTRKIALPVTQTPFKVNIDNSSTASRTFELRSRSGAATYKRTLLSAVDGSAQYYAVRPSMKNDGMVLSLHGASVEATNQADAYGPKKWGPVVCPTNRRPFGFDWEDVGRLDALEVLEDAKGHYKPDPSRTYLTGHSMGGHGTWQLGAHFPGMFAAIAPAAGWISFDSYVGGPNYDAKDSIEEMLLRANNPTQTNLLLNNFVNFGTFILHGDADETVPIREARKMRDDLAKIRPAKLHEEPGGGHWYDTNPLEPGADCVDFPPIFDYFLQHRIPDSRDMIELDFTTIAPQINSRLHWVQINTQIRPMMPSRIRARWNQTAGIVEIKAENTLSFTLDFPDDAAQLPRELRIDGEKHLLDTARISFEKVDSKWSIRNIETPHKDFEHGFKSIFNHNFAFVVGTGGDSETDQMLMDQAQFEAQQYWYRGNATPEVLTDREALNTDLSKRSVILFGNRSNNLAWSKFVPKSFPPANWLPKKPHAILALVPEPTYARSVAVLSGSNPIAQRWITGIPFFLAGASLPDWMVINEDYHLRGSQGIASAGFYGPRGDLEKAEIAFR